jgi:hypothetical protein
MISIYKKNSLNVDENYINHIINFIKFTSKLLKINDDFNIILLGKGQDSNSTTGGYNKGNNSITVLYEDRALIDILRSIAHEIEHQRQNQFDLIGDQPQNIGGFLENDANIIAGILIKLYVKYIDDHNIYWM